MKRLFSYLLLLPIYFYQKCISPMTSPSCRFTPTCSQYAVEAIKKHGPFKGLYLAIRRVFCVVILGVVPDMIPFHEASCRHTYASLATNPRDGYRKLLSGCFCSERGGMVFSGYTSLVCAGCYYFECAV